MKELLVEFLSLVLNEERKFKAVKVTGGEERVSSFSTQANADAAIAARTHRQYNPNTDKNLPGAGDDESEQPIPPRAGDKSWPGMDKPAAPAKKPEVPFQERQQDAQRAITKLYGKNGGGKLLQESPASDAALANGYKEGEWWVAPGNAGSNFNENMSNEGACILAVQPDLSEDELAMILFEKTRGTVLGKQQVDSPIKSEDKIVVPKEITSEDDKETYKSCTIAARSARRKYRRMSAGVAAAQKAVGFGAQVKITGVGGTSRKDNTPADVVTDKEKILSAIESAPKCFIYDPETGKTYEIPKDVLTQWVNDSGGGENAADTVVFATDENGNLLYDGWSDKKTLSDLQANSSLNNDMSRGIQRIDMLLENKMIEPRDAAHAKKLLEDAQEEIAKTELGYKLIASRNAKYFSTRPAEERAKIELAVAKDTTKRTGTSKHYKKFKEKVDAVKNGKGKSDAKSVAIAEAISGKERTKSKEEIQAEKFITEQLELYGEEDIKGFRENPDIPDDIKKQVIKASEAGADGRKKYMDWFNNEWLKKNKAKVKSATPFTVLCRVAKNPNMISADERKILERTAVRERLRKLQSGTKPSAIPEGLQGGEELSRLRKIALDNQREVFKSLEKMPARTDSGKKTTVGALLGFEDAKDALHLDKINLPEDDTDFKQILKRSTQLVMEGIAVTPATIKECLGVNNTQDLQDHFVVGFEDERFQKSDEGFITGKTVALYMVVKDRKVEIAPKVFRSKSGPTGKTQNTLQWSEEMQKCFDSKRNNE